MSRTKVLFSRPKRTLAGMATILVAVGVTFASGANFTAQTANPSNTFSTGNMSMDNDKDGAAILTASDLRPGGPSESGEVVITNDGTIAGDFTLSRGAITNSDATNPLTGVLDLVVKDCSTGATAACGEAGDTSVYSGKVTAMGTGIALGNFAPSDSRRYEFTVSLPGTAGDVYEADNGSAAFVWDAVSS